MRSAFGFVVRLLTSQAAASGRGAVIYVDPCTADLHDDRLRMTQEACAARGVECVSVWSAGFAQMLCNKPDTTAEEREEILAALAPPAGEEEAWAAANLAAADDEGLEEMARPVIGVICGSDAGLCVSERLAHTLAPSRSHGLLSARRDKYEMHEALRAAGVACCRQAVASEWREAEAFLRSLPSPLAAVIKPRRGQASMRVSLARSLAEAEAAFGRVLELPATLDDEAETSSALLQEHLSGEEYVVDTVSRDGEHKVTALWRYDKGEANGAPFVYFGIQPVGTGSDRARAVAEYALEVLDALKWRWGPVHMEVMFVDAPGGSGDAGSRGPVLIEANAGRFNGEEFKLIADVCFGVNAYDAYFAALFGEEEAWEAVPHTPPAELNGVGMLVKLVSHVGGIVSRINHLDEIYELQSIARVKLEAEEGERVQRTVDLNSCGGDIVLLNADADVVAADYATLRQLQPTLYEVEDDETDEDAVAGASGSALAGASGGSAAELPTPMPPAERLRFEAEEATRLAALVLGGASGPDGAERCVARFPLVDIDYELDLPAESLGAREYRAHGARKLGEALLRAIRTATDEAAAMGNMRGLLLAGGG